jgi:uncharacterized protein DUF4339
MMYYLIDEMNQQQGPFTIAILKAKGIRKTTKVWCEGMDGWKEAGYIDDLRSIFNSTPPPPPHTAPSPSSPPPPRQGGYQNNNNQPAYNAYPVLTSKPIYEDYFDPNSLSDQEREDFKKNFFFDNFSTGVAILLHFVTFGIFTFIFCGLKFDKLPKLHHDDFGAGKAIGFMFIPIFNLYWLFMFWRSLAKRINLQFKLRNRPDAVSLGLATTVCILTLIPYVGMAVNFLILKPILFSQIQNASNELALDNLQRR